MSYNITGAESAMSVNKTGNKSFRFKRRQREILQTDHSKILKRNDQKGPIIVHLDKHEWATIQDEFGEAECGGNLPVGWILWRVYSVNIPGYYKPVLIKKSDSEETKCYRVHDEWLFAFFPQYRTLL